jgi:Holliday junction DNA helicase RuvA
MFYSLTGTLIHKDMQTAAVECAGVAFLCNITATTYDRLGPEGSKVTLYTYLSVKEDALDLYGFFSEDELKCFRLLITVSGVGPKAATAVLSAMTPSKLALAVASGDHKTISQLSKGVGDKTAQRIVLELHEKMAAGLTGEEAQTVKDISSIPDDDLNVSSAISALVQLGYSQTDAARAVSQTDTTLSVSDMIKNALKKLM